MPKPTTATVTHTRADDTTYRTVWTRTDWYCPNCGKRKVWEDNCEDYYLDNHFICIGCSSSFYLPGSVCQTDDQQTIDQIKEQL